NFQNNASATLTRIGSKVNVSLIASDNVQLDYYVCAHNQTGTLTNGTAVDISGTSYPISYIITVTQLEGSNVSYNCWFNDTSGNDNSTYIDYFLVVEEPVITATYLLDSWEGDEDDEANVYNCSSDASIGQPFNNTRDLIAEDTLEIEILVSGATQLLDAEDIINVSIVKADTDGAPTGSIVYATNLTRGDWWKDAGGWQAENITFNIDFDMDMGWYIMVFACPNCDRSVNERLTIRTDKGSTYHGMPNYGYVEIDAGCNPLGGVAEDWTTRT
ncbi:unnamed protein product, partial [marine sediment metagenome]